MASRKGYVYKLVSLVDPEMPPYFGSTFNMKKRLSRHEKPGNTCTSRAIIETGSYSMAELECVWVKDRRELDRREDLWIRNHECLNVHRAYKTKEEKLEYYREFSRKRREADPERVRENIRRWRESNPDRVREFQLDLLVKITCGRCGSVVGKGGIRRHQRSEKCKRLAEARKSQPKITEL